MDFEQAMKLALNLYQIGKPVVLKGTNGEVIHGGQNETYSDRQVIDGIDPALWNASNWPQTFEGARGQWLRDRKG